MKNKSVFIGWMALLGSIILFSSVEIVGKKINEKGYIDPYTMVFLRFFVTGVILTILSLPGYLRSGKKFSWLDFRYFFINGFIGIAVSISLFHAAIEMFANASSSAVVFSANGVFTAILARFMNNEGWTWRKWVAVLFGLAGTACFIFEKGTPTVSALSALVVMSLAAFCFSFSVCYARRHAVKYGPMLFMGISSLVGGIVVLPVALWRMEPEIVKNVVAVLPEVTYVVLACTTLAYFLFYYGIAKTTAFAASMSFFLKPVLACLLAWIILGEILNAWTWAGTGMIMVGMCFIVNFKALRETWQK